MTISLFSKVAGGQKQDELADTVTRVNVAGTKGFLNGRPQSFHGSCLDLRFQGASLPVSHSQKTKVHGITAALHASALQLYQTLEHRIFTLVRAMTFSGAAVPRFS